MTETALRAFPARVAAAAATLPGIVVNGAFRGQRVTGQQRFATEIADRLARRTGVRAVAGEGRGADSPIRAWAAAQLAGFGRTAGERLVTLTSRGPLAARRHVVAIHDLFVLDHPEWYAPRYVATHAPVLRAQLRHAELVLAVSEPVAERIRGVVAGRVPVVTVPNAPSDLFRPDVDAPTSIAAHGIAAGSYVFAVSSDEPRKNFARLVAAHAALPESVRRAHPLVIAGGRSAIYASTSHEHDGDTVRLGYVDDDELARLYAHAAVVAVPSLDEGFGLPAVEALAAGADVVASDVPVLRWVCGDAVRYADPLSVDAIRDAVLDALLRPTPETVRAARATAIRARFSWEHSAQTVYDAVMALPTGGTR